MFLRKIRNEKKFKILTSSFTKFGTQRKMELQAPPALNLIQLHTRTNTNIHICNSTKSRDNPIVQSNNFHGTEPN
jgi:hypothetical protein